MRFCPRSEEALPAAEMAVWHDDEIDPLLDDSEPRLSPARDNRPEEEPDDAA